MKLAIGDVVRDHRDMALGTVVGVADHASGKLVAFCISGDLVRVSAPEDLDVIARHTVPMTKTRQLMARVSLAIALFAALVSGLDAWSLTADWRFTCVTALGGYAVIALAFHCGSLLVGPRRFRV